MYTVVTRKTAESYVLIFSLFAEQAGGLGSVREKCLYYRMIPDRCLSYLHGGAMIGGNIDSALLSPARPAPTREQHTTYLCGAPEARSRPASHHAERSRCVEIDTETHGRREGTPREGNGRGGVEKGVRIIAF